MIDSIIRWSLHNRLVVLTAAFILLVWGAVETTRTPVDVFPDLTAPTVTVITEAHGMAPEEVETLVTFPIETALNGAAGVRRIRSSTGGRDCTRLGGVRVGHRHLSRASDCRREAAVGRDQHCLPRSSRPFWRLSPRSWVRSCLWPCSRRGAAPWTYGRWSIGRSGPACSRFLASHKSSPSAESARRCKWPSNSEKALQRGISLSDVIDATRRGNENASAGFLVDGPQENVVGDRPGADTRRSREHDGALRRTAIRSL